MHDDAPGFVFVCDPDGAGDPDDLVTRRSLAQLGRMWRRVNLAPDDPRRGDLAPDRTREWFGVCRPKSGSARTIDEQIVELVRRGLDD